MNRRFVSFLRRSPCVCTWRRICRYRILGVLDFFRLYLCGVSSRIMYSFPFASLKLLVWVRIISRFLLFLLTLLDEPRKVCVRLSPLFIYLSDTISNNKTTDFFIDCISRDDYRCILQYCKAYCFLLYFYKYFFEIENTAIIRD